MQTSGGQRVKLIAIDTGDQATMNYIGFKDYARIIELIDDSGAEIATAGATNPRPSYFLM